MPDAKIIEVCDALVTQIGTAWSPTAPNAVERVYLAPIGVQELSSLTGRKVYVFPALKSDEPATRGEDLKSYTIAIVIVERYTDAGMPTRAWMDALVYFVENTIEGAIDFDGRTLLSINSRELWTQALETSIYDLEMLNEKNLFYSEIEVTMQEILAV